MELDWVSTGLMIFFSVLAGSFIPVLRNIAPRTENTIDDKVLEGIQALVDNRALIEGVVSTVHRWADPEDPAVPVAPQSEQ